MSDLILKKWKQSKFDFRLTGRKDGKQMSILIEGIDMPTPEQGVRTINIYADGVVTNYAEEAIGKAVPLPQHGDLVDRDALEQDAQGRLVICNKYENQFQKPYEVMRAIALAPTIIPAEGEKK